MCSPAHATFSDRHLSLFGSDSVIRLVPLGARFTICSLMLAGVSLCIFSVLVSPFRGLKERTNNDAD
jgi:hypothetical protein